MAIVVILVSLQISLWTVLLFQCFKNHEKKPADLRQLTSSDPSAQSCCMSHRKRALIHVPGVHRNWLDEQLRGGQLRSSLMSPQSLSPSHSQLSGLHRPLAHWNLSNGHECSANSVDKQSGHAQIQYRQKYTENFKLKTTEQLRFYPT
jgi:hypothetical protein